MAKKPESGSSKISFTSHGIDSAAGLSSVDLEYRRDLAALSNSRTHLVDPDFLGAPMVVQPVVPETATENLALQRMLGGNKKAKTSFHKAARDGNVEAIQELIDTIRKPDLDPKQVEKILKYKLDKKDRNDYTAMHYAVRYGHGQIVQVLIDAGADVNASGDDGTQPIHLASRHMRAGRPERISLSINQVASPARHTIPILQILLNGGADCNAGDAYMQTPLHYATTKGNLQAVEMLMNTPGIKIEAEDKSRSTPLHCACSQGSIQIVRTLTLKDASLSKRDDEGHTPFHYAVMSGHLKLLKDIIDQLLRTTGEINLSELLTDRDQHDQTALHLAVASGNYDVTRLLLEKGSSVNDSRFGMITPLHLAASNGDIEIVQLLLSYSAEIEARNSQGETALHRAAAMNRETVVNFLIERGARMNSFSEDGSTPLILAAEMDNKRVVSALVNKGAQIDYADASEKTALYWAANENAIDSLRILLSCPDSVFQTDVGDRYDNTPLHVAAMKGYTGIVKMLIERGAKLDAVNDEELTPLHLSAQNGHVRVVRQLLQRKANMVSDIDEAANTPLHHAALAGHADVIEALLDFGATVDNRNAALWTPLDCAAANGHVNAASALLDRDSPVDPIDRAKTTPLHLASKGGFVEMTRLLLKSGADISLADAEGKNCLDLAVDNGYKDTALAILEHRDWQVAMRRLTAESNGITSPMRRMIKNLPSVALEVFNKCITRGKQNGYETVTLNYEFLDDTYADWSSGTDVNEAISKTVGEFLNVMIKEQTKTSFDKDLDKKENHPLALMVEHEAERLLTHPLVKSLIEAKWSKFGQHIYYSKLILYFIFLFFLTGYAVVSTPLNPVLKSTNGTKICVGNALPNDVTVDFFVRAGWVIVTVLAGIQLLLELLQVINRKISYFASSENIIELVVFILAIVYVAAYEFKGDQYRLDRCGAMHISIGSLAIFLAWINLLLFLRKIPRLGIYFVMFTDVLKTFSLFSVTFSLFIIAFALGFYILLNTQMPSFSSPGKSIMKTVIMMIGEFEFDALFNDTARDQQPFPITWVLFALFVVTMTIILMNLLVGLAVDDIKAVQDKAALKRMAMQVDLVLDVEKFIPRKFRNHKIFRNKTREVIRLSKQKTLREYLKPHPASISAIEDAKKSSKETIDVVEENTKSLAESVARMQLEMKTITFQVNGMESMLRTLLQQQNLPIDYVESVRKKSL